MMFHLLVSDALSLSAFTITFTILATRIEFHCHDIALSPFVVYPVVYLVVHLHAVPRLLPTSVVHRIYAVSNLPPLPYPHSSDISPYPDFHHIFERCSRMSFALTLPPSFSPMSPPSFIEFTSFQLSSRDVRPIFI
jgi:hypothetical protein